MRKKILKNHLCPFKATPFFVLMLLLLFLASVSTRITATGVTDPTENTEPSESAEENPISPAEAYANEQSPASDFEYRILRKKVSITNYIGTNPVVVIPYVIEGYPVCYIEMGSLTNPVITTVKAHSQITDVESFSIGVGITYIMNADTDSPSEYYIEETMEPPSTHEVDHEKEESVQRSAAEYVGQYTDTEGFNTEHLLLLIAGVMLIGGLFGFIRYLSKKREK